MSARIEACGEAALLLHFGTSIDADTNARVHAAQRALSGLPGIAERVPAYASLLLILEPPGRDQADPVAARSALIADIEARLADATESTEEQSSVVEIPVAYGGADGPDLIDLAAQLGLAPDTVIALHTAPEYRVAMLGFAPGFPYLLGLDERIAAPRRASPRTQVPAGSVAIGGAQTGVYPRELPGGWQLIGRTDAVLFDLARDPPCLFAPGARVRFRAVDAVAASPAARAHRAPHRTPARVDVIAPGLLTSIQDAGRPGHAAWGIGCAGAMDTLALRLANALVGNAPDAAAFECAMLGPELRFSVATVVALAGAEMSASVDGVPLPMWRPVALPTGARVRIGAARRGAFAYLAVGGGLDVDVVLGSRSSDLNAGIGGRALRAGDNIPLSTTRVCSPVLGNWSIDPQPWFDPDPQRPIRLIAGTDHAGLDAASKRALEQAEFRIAATSNRVGYRLDGPRLALAAAHEAISAGVPRGTVQLPPGGQPIVLLAEHPTTGGYPRLGHVAQVDLPRLAQRRPGDALRFALVDSSDALLRWHRQRRALSILEHSVQARHP